MTAVKRIIPCLDVKDGRVVKGVNFVALRDAGDPVEIARAYSEAGADELCFLDITATNENRGTMLEVVKRTVEQISIPLTVGGGVRTLDDIELLLKAGAQKISINTRAVSEPGFVASASERFGRQAIVVAVDAKAVATLAPEQADQPVPEWPWRADYPEVDVWLHADSRWELFTHGGRNRTGIDVVKWSKWMEAQGAGEILLTSMDRDGTRDGYDLAVTRAVSDALDIPVIASGGVGALEHFLAGFEEGHADAVLAASVFHFNQLKIAEVKNYLAERGIRVRR